VPCGSRVCGCCSYDSEEEMPTYVYECGKCGEFEYRQSMASPALERCPQCGAPVKRPITGGMGHIVRGRGTPATYCSSETPCCGRPVRCDEPPCER
jgi:putative FmdB family regulatory protein